MAVARETVYFLPFLEQSLPFYVSVTNQFSVFSFILSQYDQLDEELI